MTPRDPRETGHGDRCDGDECKACSGEACDLCGAGCWNNDPDRPECTHDVIDRHEYGAGRQKR